MKKIQLKIKCLFLVILIDATWKVKKKEAINLILRSTCTANPKEEDSSNKIQYQHFTSMNYM
jgi:hypothetical protein